MKTICLSLFALIVLARAALADDVAVIQFRVGHEKPLPPVTIEFYAKDAPQTVENFKKLAHKGFYKGIKVHRVFPHMLVQAGDPLSRRRDRTNVGTGGPGYTLPAEIYRKHIDGAVAMSHLSDKINPARRSSGSQFYICLKPMPNLDGQYTVFAHVLNGWETLEKISMQSADSNDNPVERVTIQSVKIVPRS